MRQAGKPHVACKSATGYYSLFFSFLCALCVLCGSLIVGNLINDYSRYARVMHHPKLPSGIPGLDSALGGGFLPGTLVVVVGSTGIGKTQWGIQFVNDPKQIVCLLLYTSHETTLEGLLERPLDEGDLLSNANTVIYMGKIRDGMRFRRALYVAKHRGSACSEEILPYTIGDTGITVGGV
jgi:KaiC/GvpD/RAD55 family RecA-like ATPase